MIGEIVHDLIHHSHPDGSPFAIHECRMNLALNQEKEIYEDDEFLWKADGTLIPVEFWSHPVVVNGRIEGAVVTFFDISERKQAEKDLRQAKLEAEIANRAKSDFLLNTSHEFRTPLNAVIGYAKLLETADEQNRKEYAESIIESGNRLLDMVDDILELIRTEKSEFVPEYDFVETYGFFREFERRFAWTIARKNVLFKTNLAADLPETIRVDIKRLRLVISNLLENAVKFTDKGKIELQVYQKKTDKEKRNTTEIIIEVIDTGDRITEEDQKRILDVFSQKENKTISGEISIGLSLVSRIVNMLNGTIQVITQAGMGSRFVVSFPNITYSSNEKQVPGDEVKPDPAKWVEDPGEIIDLKGLMADLEGDCLETSKTFENKQPIAEVRKFGMTLTRLGEKHNCAMISDFGQKLADAADNFDIHGILKMIGMYPELIQALKA
jgi:signal transduction histidine kinase